MFCLDDDGGRGHRDRVRRDRPLHLPPLQLTCQSCHAPGSKRDIRTDGLIQVKSPRLRILFSKAVCRQSPVRRQGPGQTQSRVQGRTDHGWRPTRSRSRPMTPSVSRCPCIVRSLFRAARCWMPMTAGAFPLRMRSLLSWHGTSRVPCRPSSTQRVPANGRARGPAGPPHPSGGSSARSAAGARGNRCAPPAQPDSGAGVVASVPEADRLCAILERAECYPESITMTIPCPIFRLRPAYWLILALIVFFSVTVAVHAEQVFSSDSAPIPAMWLGSMALVLGLRDWRLFYIWMAGWVFAGLWLVLQVAGPAWLL